MNLQEAKALFFAQYYGQKIMGSNVSVLNMDLIDPAWAIRASTLGQWPQIENSYLLLRSVNQLNDGEYITLVEITGCVNGLNTVNVGKWICDNLNLLGFSGSDYLRSIGVLLPFTYLNESNKPITLQPNEIIALGWAKIKES